MPETPVGAAGGEAADGGANSTSTSYALSLKLWLGNVLDPAYRKTPLPPTVALAGAVNGPLVSALDSAPTVAE